MEGDNPIMDATFATATKFENLHATGSDTEDLKAEGLVNNRAHQECEKGIALDTDHHISDEEHFHPEASMVNEDEACKCFHSMGIGEKVNHENEYLDGKGLPGMNLNKKDEICAVCHDRIKMQETAQVKGCEHTYCVTCILRWASYKKEPWCPQCRLPFSFLYVYKALDGKISDYMFEESVCLLLRAFWFKPLIIEDVEEQDDYQDDYDVYEECYYPTNVRLGNRRWGDTGYVRGGRREARPIGVRQGKGKEPAKEPIDSTSGGSSSSQGKGKELAKEPVGRRALRAQKRQQIDTMAAKSKT